jgi:TRAP transporter 4TM/12TM fusion protein
MDEHTRPGHGPEQPSDNAPGDTQQAFGSLAQGDNEDTDSGDQSKVQKLLEKEDRSKRSLNRFWGVLALGLCAVMSGFYIYTAGTLPASVEWQRGLYVMLTYILILMMYPAISPGGKVATWWQETFGDGAAEGEDTGERKQGGPLRIIGKILAPSGAPNLFDLVLIVLSIGTIGYYILQFEQLQFRAGNYNETDAIIGTIGILISLEISRRVLGWSMTLIGVIFLLYLRFGEALYGLPVLDAFAHRGREWDRIATIIFFDQEGIFGVMANVLVTYVILFIFFGAFLRKSGASRFFIDLPLALAGRTTGGPAKVAVISSALFGSISGSAIANTVSTGAFTIPMMKRAGFRPHVAGAIEPSASIGGMFMPPVMGAGAFLMAELTNIPYAQIVLISIFPAILYFTSVLTMVHFEAKKHKLQGIETEQTALQIIRRDWYLAVPLIIIITLLIARFSPGYAAFWSIASCIVLMYTLPDNRDDFRISAHISVPVFVFVLLMILGYSSFITTIFQGIISGNIVSGEFGSEVARAFRPSNTTSFWPFAGDAPPIYSALLWAAVAFGIAFAYMRGTQASLSQQVTAFRRSTGRVLHMVYDAMIEGARDTLVIGATVGVIGIIVGTIFATGVGLRFSDIIVSLSSGSTLLAIALIALASLVLGMGVPVTASYLIVAVLAVPALQDLGVSLIAAHMIVYWFSQDSNITPPVCVAAYAGAAISGSDPWKTGWTAFKFAKLLYVMPVLFAFSPAILLVGETGQILTDLSTQHVIAAYISGFLGTVAFSAATMGYLVRRTSWWEWLIFAFGTFLCFFPNLLTDLTGVAIILAVWVWQTYDVKRRAQLAEEAGEGGGRSPAQEVAG